MSDVNEQEYNENSLFKHQYDREKGEFQKREHIRLFGLKKKKSKYTVKQRRQIRFFAGL